MHTDLNTQIESLTAKYAALDDKLAAIETRVESGALKPSPARPEISSREALEAFELRQWMRRPRLLQKTGFSLVETVLATVAVGALTVGAIQAFSPAEFSAPLQKLADHQEETVSQFEALEFSAAPAVRLAWETSKPIGIDLMNDLKTLTTPATK